MAHLSPLGIATKWLVIPLAVGALGYYVVGPRIGGDVEGHLRKLKLDKAAKSLLPSGVLPSSGNQSEEPPAAVESPAPAKPRGPEVDVTVRPVRSSSSRSSARDEERPRRRPRRESTPAPARTSEPPVDEGSVSGIDQR